MPNLTIEQQRAIGGEVARLLAPLPENERLLLLTACLYGEGTSQGLTQGEIVAFCERITQVHAAGVTIQRALSRECPLCGTPRGLFVGKVPS
jgi:hypothetical protein